MKKLFLFLFLLLFHFANAGTGSAKDIAFLYLGIAGVLVFILGVYFLINFIRRIIKKCREKETSQTDDNADNNNNETPEKIIQ